MQAKTPSIIIELHVHAHVYVFVACFKDETSEITINSLFTVFREAVEALLQTHTWKDSLLNQRMIPKGEFSCSNDLFVTPMRLLFTKMPDLAQTALNKFITTGTPSEVRLD